jgi:hypothetical protein
MRRFPQARFFWNRNLFEANIASRTATGFPAANHRHPDEGAELVSQSHCRQFKSPENLAVPQRFALTALSLELVTQRVHACYEQHKIPKN